MATTRFADHLLTGIHSARPAASAVPAGTLYSCTTHGLIYQSDGASTWSTYATLGSIYGGAGTDTIYDAKGDLVAGSGADAAARLAVGTNNQVLTADSGQTLGVKWASPSTVGTSNLDDLADVQAPTPTDEQALTWDSSASKWVPKTAILHVDANAKGDLFAASANDVVGRLAVGSNNQVLTADSAQTLGVKWAAAPGASGVAGDTLWDTKGDLAAATGADAASKLAAGTNGKVLTADSGQTTGLKWQLTKDIEVKVLDDATVLTTGEGKLIFCIPASLGGCDLTAVAAFVTTVSSSGAPSIGIRNVTQSAVEMLTTNLTIDASEFTSYTAATPAVIDSGNKDVATGDLIAVDVDTAGTGAKGLGVILTFTLP